MFLFRLEGEDSVPDTIQSMARRAREASFSLAGASLEARNQALEAIAREIENHMDNLLAVNAADVEAATAEGLSAPLLSRLKLTRAKCAGMAERAAVPGPAAGPAGEGTVCQGAVARLEPVPRKLSHRSGGRHF